MQKIFFLLFFIISGFSSFSQQEFFVYFQADNHQPFYARIDSRIYSSTEYGYMIIPKLGDSVYLITVGFAKNAFPEQSFQVPINKKDHGYQLKNTGERGWSLVDMQNMSVIMNNGLPSKASPEFSGTRKTDAFSEMLADVVNDSAILYSAVKPKPPEPVIQKQAAVVTKPAEQEKKQPDSTPATTAIVQAPVKKPIKMQDTVSKAAEPSTGITAAPANIAPKDSVLKEVVAAPKEVVSAPKETVEKTKDSIPPAIAKIPDTVRAAEPVVAGKPTAEKPFISKVEEKKTDEMYQATYLEQYIYRTDTVKIIIPLMDQPATTAPMPVVTEKKVESVPEQKVVTEEKTATAKPVIVDTLASNKRSSIQITNSDCINLATDYDVDKLRVKLLNDKTIDDKLATSKKYFKSKCFLVKQIKALTELFPTDETKYLFFDTSYPYVSDTSNFYQLGDLIENDYYKNRFKAMIHK